MRTTEVRSEKKNGLRFDPCQGRKKDKQVRISSNRTAWYDVWNVVSITPESDHLLHDRLRLEKKEKLEDIYWVEYKYRRCLCQVSKGI